MGLRRSLSGSHQQQHRLSSSSMPDPAARQSLQGLASQLREQLRHPHSEAGVRSTVPPLSAAADAAGEQQTAGLPDQQQLCEAVLPDEQEGMAGEGPQLLPPGRQTAEMPQVSPG